MLSWKRQKGTDKHMLSSKTDLGCLKTKVNNLDLDKFKTVSVDVTL